MLQRRYELTDEQWDKIKTYFEKKKGRPYKNLRNTVNCKVAHLGAIYLLVMVIGTQCTKVSASGKHKDSLKPSSRIWHQIAICKMFHLILLL